MVRFTSSACPIRQPMQPFRQPSGWTHCALSSFIRMVAAFTPPDCILLTINFQLRRQPSRQKGRVNLSETEDNVLVQVAGTEFKVDKNTGQINSWRAGGHELLISGPILNLGEDLGGGKNSGRRGQGSGGRRGSPPEISSSQPPRLMNAIVTAKMDGAVAKISVTADVYLAGSKELKGQLTYNFDIGADAQANVVWNFTWKGNNASSG